MDDRTQHRERNRDREVGQRRVFIQDAQTACGNRERDIERIAAMCRGRARARERSGPRSARFRHRVDAIEGTRSTRRP